jgi:hypothetical protein
VRRVGSVGDVLEAEQLVDPSDEVDDVAE